LFWRLIEFLEIHRDFIYADVPWYAGATAEQYNKRYRQIFSSPEMKKMVEKIRELLPFHSFFGRAVLTFNFLHLF